MTRKQANQKRKHRVALRALKNSPRDSREVPAPKVNGKIVHTTKDQNRAKHALSRKAQLIHRKRPYLLLLWRNRRR